MTNLAHLKVSLTKHNAHKIALLLKDYNASKILEKLALVQAEKAQAYKNLSVLPGGIVPDVWTQVKKLGSSAIDALVFIGIVFSHHELIDAMIHASDRNEFSGRIDRGGQLNGKAYTNFARVIDQLGFATKLNYSGVSFNLKSLFEIPGLGPLVGQLLSHKLDTAQWDHSRSVAEEAVEHSFHKVFGISSKEFKNWISTDSQPVAAEGLFLPKDEEFFQGMVKSEGRKAFKFKAGHSERAVEQITKSATEKTKVNQLHNDIQNRLYSYLSAKIGMEYVGTELDTGSGTTVDVVTKYNNKTTFFEIKTSASVRNNIRQAIPQLLEYAYWPNGQRADDLVIVSHLPINDDAKEYLQYLRDRFRLPLIYQQFDLKKNKLI